MSKSFPSVATAAKHFFGVDNAKQFMDEWKQLPAADRAEIGRLLTKQHGYVIDSTAVKAAA